MRHIFVINNFTGKKQVSDRIRKKLENQNKIEYLFFETEYEKHERELVKHMCEFFPNEQIRFYIVGGSGTLANALSGIDDFSKREIAFYPNGMSCDFLKCFDWDYTSCKIEDLINGHGVYVDYVSSNRDFCAINTYSLGFDAEVVRNLKYFRLLSILSGKLTYASAVLKTLFQMKSYNVKVTIDGKAYDGEYVWVYVGNGRCCGSRYYPMPEARPDDGMADIFLLEKASMIHCISMITHVQKGTMSELTKGVTLCRGRKISIYPAKSQTITWDYDGDIYEAPSIELEVKQQKIKIIVPQGVELK